MASRRTVWAVCFVALGVAVALGQTATVTGFDATGMIYVDMARHLARGEGIVSTIYFPSHVPKFPSPIALWPPLYPAAIAGLLAAGVDAAIASRLVSLAAFGVTVGVLWLIGAEVFDEHVGTVAALLLMAWPVITGIAAMALSENLFIMCIAISVLLTARVLRDGAAAAHRGRLAAAGGLAMAGAALTRYPGLAVMAITAVFLLANLRGGSRRDRVRLVAIWSFFAGILPVLLLLRNRVVTGAFMGRGRPPDDQGAVYHIVFAAKTLVTDGLKLLWRLTVAPEALGVDSRAMIVAVMAGAVLLLVGLLRGPRVLRALREAGAVLRTAPAALVVVVGVGYWVVMIAIRSVTAFEPMNTRMLMPGYGFVLLGAVAVAMAFFDRVGLSRRLLVRVVAVAFAVSMIGVMVPRAVAAGGPRVAPDPAPVWVQWVAANTPAGSPIIGNRSTDFSFYLDRPAYSFQVFAVYRSGDRFDRDCALISRHLVLLGWNHAYLVLHSEDGEFDTDQMARRYGPTVGQLLRGLPTTLPVVPVARHPEFAVFRIQQPQWTCETH